MRFRTGLYIVFFSVGVTLFIYSLMPSFRALVPNTFWIMLVVSIVIMGLCLFALLYKPKPEKAKYARKTSLLTVHERRFLNTLRMIEPDKYEVIPQVFLASVIEKKINMAYKSELQNAIDFCFVDKNTFEPLLLVKLDDRTIKRADRRTRDEKMVEVCADAKIPLITFRQDGNLSYPAVKKIILNNILK